MLDYLFVLLSLGLGGQLTQLLTIHELFQAKCVDYPLCPHMDKNKLWTHTMGGKNDKNKV